MSNKIKNCTEHRYERCYHETIEIIFDLDFLLIIWLRIIRYLGLKIILVVVRNLKTYTYTNEVNIIMIYKAMINNLTSNFVLISTLLKSTPF